MNKMQGYPKKRKALCIILTFVLMIGLFSPCTISAENVETVQTAESTYTAPVLTVEEACAELTWNPNGSGRWLDRMNLPDYAIKFYELLEQNVTGDGFLVNPIQDKYLLTNPLTHKTFYGIKVAETEYFKNDDVDKAKINGQIQEMILNIFHAFKMEHPECYWLNSGYTSALFEYTGETDALSKRSYCLVLYDENKNVDIRKENYRDTSIIKAEIEKRDKCINEIMAGAASYTTEVEKITYFNDWLTYHNSYNSIVGADISKSSTVSEECHECISALMGSSGETGPVCEGYAKAFKVLCNQAGIDCILSSGWAKGEGHMWNMVKLNSIWYGVDVTWNDPISSKSNAEHHKWLLAGATTKANGMTFAGSRNTCPTDPFFINEPKISETEYSTELLTSKNIFHPEDVTVNTEDKNTDNDNVLDNTIKDSGLLYKITKTATDDTLGTVSLIGAVSKTKKRVNCPNKISAFDHWVTVGENSEEQRDYDYLVTAIESKAFLDNKKLQTVCIGKNVEGIGKNAFYGCKKLKKIIIKTALLTQNSVGAKAFKGIHKKAVVKVPKKKKRIYQRLLKNKGLKVKQIK